jgi:hypothetical protein
MGGPIHELDVVQTRRKPNRAEVQKHSAQRLRLAVDGCVPIGMPAVEDDEVSRRRGVH